MKNSDTVTTNLSCPDNDIQKLKLNEVNMVECKVGKQKQLMLVDSGSTCNLVSRKCVESNELLQKLPKRSISLQTITCGNGATLTTSEAVDIEINVQGKTFQLECKILDTLGGIDIVLGNKGLCDLKANLDFHSHILTLRVKSVVAKNLCDVTLKSGETKIVKLTARLPKFMKNRDVIFKPGKQLKYVDPVITTCLSTCSNYVFCIKLTNKSDSEVQLRKNQCVGTIDLTGVPFFEEKLDCLSLKNFTNDMEKIVQRNLKKYPFLTREDPKVGKTETEILLDEVDFKNTQCNDEELKDLRKLVLDKTAAFSIHGEPGNSNHEVEFELIDDTPFKCNPYITRQEDKIMVNKHLDKLVKMGILVERESDYTSPIMAISKKGTKDKRICTDFRLLNSKIRKMNASFPLIRETMSTIGASGCEVFSVVDLKEAFHSLKLSEKCIPYTGVRASHDSRHLCYKRVAMGLSISPCVWQSYISKVIREIEGADKWCMVMVDDLLLFSKREDHLKHLNLLLSKLIEHGLKLSPRKCQLFRTNVTYLGHDLLIDEGRPCIKAMRSKCQDIRSMARPHCRKGVRRFIGAVSFLSMYLEQLATLLLPFYHLTKAKSEFVWTSQCEENFQKIKGLLINPPVLTMVRPEGQIKVFSDTSRYACGHAIFQEQDGVDRLIAFGSRTLNPACKNYSVSELELAGLFVSFCCNKYLLKSVTFAAFVDHSALVNIIKSKSEPPTRRIQLLLEKLSQFTFTLGYKPGKDMVICDFLSRVKHDDTADIADTTPVSFAKFQSEQRFTALTRSQAKAQGIVMPSLFDKGDKGGKLPSKRGEIAPLAPTPPVSLPADIDVNADYIGENTQTPQRSLDYDTIIPSRLRETPMKNPRADIGLINYDEKIGSTDFEKSADFECAERIRKPDESLFRPYEKLIREIKDENIQFRPKIPNQREIDMILKKVKETVLNDYDLSHDAKTYKEEQLKDPVLGPIYKYIKDSVTPTGTRRSIKRFMARCESYCLLENLLWRIEEDDNNPRLTLCVPDSLVTSVFDMYHSSIMGCHAGLVKMRKTIRQKFFIDHLMEKLTQYVKCCNLCGLRKSQEKDGRVFNLRIPLDFQALSEWHLDLKFMPESAQGHKYMAVITCAITRYTILICLKKKDAVTVAEAIIHNVIKYFGFPKLLVSDRDQSFCGEIMAYLLKAVGAKTKFVSPYNHGSLLAERQIQTSTNFLMSNLAHKGDLWHLYVPFVQLAMNSFVNSTGYSSHYLVFLRHPPSPLDIHCGDIMPIAKNYRDYVQLLKDRLEDLSKNVLEKQTELQVKQQEKAKMKTNSGNTFHEKQLVYLLFPTKSALVTSNRRILFEFIGPLAIYKKLDQTHFLLQDLEGKVLRNIFHFNRLKPCFIQSRLGTVSNLDSLRKAAKIENKNENPSKPQVQVVNENSVPIDNLAHFKMLFSFQSESEKIDPSQYLGKTANLAVSADLSDRQLKNSVKRIDLLPGEAIYSTPIKGRWNKGELEFLFHFGALSCWIPARENAIMVELANSCASPNKSTEGLKSLRIVGSLRKFRRQLGYSS